MDLSVGEIGGSARIVGESSFWRVGFERARRGEKFKKKKKKQQRRGTEERRGTQLFLLDECSQCSKPTVGFGMAMECFGGSGFIIANCTIRGK